MRTALSRLACVFTAAGCGTIVWQVQELSLQTQRTALMTLVIATGYSAALLCLALAVAPTRLWEFLTSRTATFVSQLRATGTPQNPRAGRALIALGLVAYSAIAIGRLSQPDDPSDDDQSAFLERAAEVHARGGPIALLRDLYAGEFPEANRHPLYIGLLSLNPTQTFGRWMSALLGLVTIISLTMLAARSQGMLCAGLFCVLLGTNETLTLLGTRAVCDTLLVLWSGLVFLLADRRDYRSHIVIGMALGLAYLTKGTGLLLFVGYVCWGVVVVVSRFRRQRPADEVAEWRRSLINLLIVVTVWTAVASPLLVRNMRRFGSPAYNVTSWLLFADAYENPLQLAERASLQEAAQNYLAGHSVGDIVRREASGLAWETFILLRILGPWPLEDARVLIGVPLMLCAIITIIVRPRSVHLLLLLWALIFVTLFAWYIPIAAGDRFPLPLLAPLLILAAEGVVQLTCWRLRRSQDGC